MIMTVSTLLLVTALSAGLADPGTQLGIEQEVGASAQGASPASDADRIRQRVAEGQQVRVINDQGQEWRGRISALAAETLTVVTRDRQRADISYGSILRIDRPHDGLANGALIGLAVGAALGFGAVIAEENAECQPGAFFSCGDPTPAAYVVVPAVVGGLGAAMGVGIDALIRKDVNLYRRAGGAGVTVVPALGHGKRGVAVALRW
jgi:hypothetical protein